MNRLVVILLPLFMSALWVAAIDDDDTDDLWEAYKEKYNKTYDTPEEEQEGRKNLEKNMLHIALHNVKDEHEYDKDIHEYSDMSVSEQIESLCGTELPEDFHSSPAKNFTISERAAPSQKNWVSEGKVSAVKNQGSCGSCWSFSATQALESQAAINWGYVWTLNEQQLLDCAGGKYGNNGCNGGWPQSAFDYMRENNGLVEEYCYPYTAKVGTCNINSNCQRFWVTSHTNVGPAGDEGAVVNALATHGPLTCAIYVSNEFMHYSGGVFTDKTYTNQGVNHAVLLVGYGNQNGQDYWLIKNSWGESWGEKGYIKLRRNYGNHLNVASYTSYPTM